MALVDYRPFGPRDVSSSTDDRVAYVVSQTSRSFCHFFLAWSRIDRPVRHRFEGVTA